MNSSSDPFLLDKQLCFALYAASLAMSKTYKPHLEKVGLTYPQYLVMLVLWEQDDRTVSDIGQQLFLDSGTLTPLLKRLETSAYVKRTRDANDERKVRVALTANGKQLKRKLNHVPNELFKATLCSRKEATALTDTLRSLRENLGSNA